MTFDEILAQVLELLRREGRVSYRALKRRFDLDDDYLEDLKAEIIQLKSSRWTRMAPCWSDWDAAIAPAPVGDQDPPRCRTRRLSASLTSAPRWKAA
jgi:hypothetical protein